MEYTRISENIFNCDVCPTRCDGHSKGVYDFDSDVRLSEYYEEKIIAYINSKGKYTAKKTEKDGYPDLEIYTPDHQLKEYIEIKVQQRTFMNVRRSIPKANLFPSETLALNLSDLERYFDIFHQEGKPLCIAWVLLNRPCILQSDEYRVYVQKIEKLEEIFHEKRMTRRFRRESGIGDIVDNEHKGVVVNYHFSLKELEVWHVEM